MIELFASIAIAAIVLSAVVAWAVCHAGRDE